MRTSSYLYIFICMWVCTRLDNIGPLKQGGAWRQRGFGGSFSQDTFLLILRLHARATCSFRSAFLSGATAAAAVRDADQNTFTYVACHVVGDSTRAWRKNVGPVVFAKNSIGLMHFLFLSSRSPYLAVCCRKVSRPFVPAPGNAEQVTVRCTLLSMHSYGWNRLAKQRLFIFCNRAIRDVPRWTLMLWRQVSEQLFESRLFY